MNNLLKIPALTFALSLAACGGESAAGGGAATGPIVADASQNWVGMIARTEAGGFRMGNPDAPIRIVEFASLTCPACATFAEESFGPLTKNYISEGIASFEVRHFVRDPLDFSAALLIRCNGEAPFFRLNERLFANQAAMFESFQAADRAQLQALDTPEAIQSGRAFIGVAEVAGLIGLVGGLGISDSRARECLTDRAAIEKLQAMRNSALNEHNIEGTPSFLINGDLVDGVSDWNGLDARLQKLAQ